MSNITLKEAREEWGELAEHFGKELNAKEHKKLERLLELDRFILTNM